MSLARSAYQIAFEQSPIILVGGIAGNMGGFLPIIALTESTNLVSGLLHLNFSQALGLSSNDYFARFNVVQANLINYRIGKYPFANQKVAANAIISDVLNVNVAMSVPARTSGGYYTKLTTMAALKTTIDIHVELGGLFHVLTPSYYYTNMVLLGLECTEQGDSKQPQVDWLWRFEKPLVTTEEANQVFGSLMDKIANKLPVSSPTWTGLKDTVTSGISALGGLPKTVTGLFS
jgi:hypothetical protein